METPEPGKEEYQSGTQIVVGIVVAVVGFAAILIAIKLLFF